MTVAESEKKLAAARVIDGIVTTMRTLSAVQLRHGGEALRELRDFELVLRESLSKLEAPVLVDPAPPSRIMLIVIGSDQGMCGALTRRVVDLALARSAHLDERLGDVIAVGYRTVDRLRDGGVGASKAYTSPASIDGAERLVERLGETLEHAVVEGHDGVEVVYTQHSGSGAGVPSVTRVFPVDRRRLSNRDTSPKRPGSVQLLEPSADVVRAVYRLWTITETHRAIVESLTAEHSARLRTTDAAQRAIEARIEALILERNHLRQNQITEELHEIVAGAGALGRDRPDAQQH